MSTLKGKAKFSNVLIGQYLLYFFPPFLYVILGLTGYLFWRTGGMDYFRQKAYLKAGIFALDVFLIEWLLFFVIVVILSVVMKVAGRFRLGLLETELTFSEDSYKSKTAEMEQNFLLKNVNRFAETPWSFYWFNNANQMEAYPKTCFNPEERETIRKFFAPKRSRYLEWVCRWGLGTYLFLIAGLAGVMMYPRYSVIRDSSNFQAYSDGQEAVALVSVNLTGVAEQMLYEVHPYLRPKGKAPDYFQTTETRLFRFKDGKVDLLPVQRIPFGGASLVGIGDSLYLQISRGGPKVECQKLIEGIFKTVDPKELEEARRSCDEIGMNDSKWTRFSLWDQGEEEEEDPQAGGTYTATFNEPSGKAVQVDWEKPFYDIQSGGFLKNRYSWKGKGSTEGETLVETDNHPQGLDPKEFHDLFPMSMAELQKARKEAAQ